MNRKDRKGQKMRVLISENGGSEGRESPNGKTEWKYFLWAIFIVVMRKESIRTISDSVELHGRNLYQDVGLTC